MKHTFSFWFIFALFCCTWNYWKLIVCENYLNVYRLLIDVQFPTFLACFQRPDGSFIKPLVQDNGDGTYTVQYVPDDLGTYVLRVKFAGKEVPNSPFKVTSHPTGDASKCVITGKYPSNNSYSKVTKWIVVLVFICKVALTCCKKKSEQCAVFHFAPNGKVFKLKFW